MVDNAQGLDASDLVLSPLEVERIVDGNRDDILCLIREEMDVLVIFCVYHDKAATTKQETLDDE